MIVVTAPTSQIDQQALSGLLEADQYVRVVVRDPARLPADVAERVEVAVGSHGDAGAARGAFTGADRGGHCTASLAVDDLIAGSRVHYGASAMPSFMDDVARQATALHEDGLLTSIVGADGVLPRCATVHLTAAVDLLVDPTWIGVAEVPGLGAAGLSSAQMAGVLTDVLGRPVRFEHLPVETHREQLLAAGMAQAKADGLDDGVPRTSDDTTPTTSEQWSRTHLAPEVQTP